MGRKNNLLKFIFTIIFTFLLIMPVYAKEEKHRYYYDPDDVTFYYDMVYTGNTALLDPNVKLIFHFHDDKGNDKTAEYYYKQSESGANNNAQNYTWSVDDANKKILEDAGFSSGDSNVLNRKTKNGGSLKNTENKNDFIDKYENNKNTKTTNQAQVQGAKTDAAAATNYGANIVFPKQNSSKVNKTDKGTCDAIIGRELTEKVQGILDLIRYLGPVLVIIFTTLDFIKTVATGNTDDLSKAGKQFARRLVAALALFLVVLIVKMLLGFFGITVPEDCLK